MWSSVDCHPSAAEETMHYAYVSGKVPKEFVVSDGNARLGKIKRRCQIDARGPYATPGNDDTGENKNGDCCQ